MVAVGAMAISSELRRPVAATRARSAVQRSVSSGEVAAPHRSGCSAPSAARRVGVRGVRAELLGEGRGGLERGEVDLLGDPGGQLAGPRVVEGQAQREEHVLQAHDAEAHRPPARVRGGGLLARVVVDVDDAVEERHRGAHRLAQPLPVDAETNKTRNIYCRSAFIWPRHR